MTNITTSTHIIHRTHIKHDTNKHITAMANTPTTTHTQTLEIYHV